MAPLAIWSPTRANRLAGDFIFTVGLSLMNPRSVPMAAFPLLASIRYERGRSVPIGDNVKRDRLPRIGLFGEDRQRRNPGRLKYPKRTNARSRAFRVLNAA